MHYKKGDDAQVALDSAYLAMAAYVQGYNASDKDQRDVDMRYMVRVCEVITNNWPQSDRANDARMQIGRVYNQTKEFAKAAEWYRKAAECGHYPSQARLGQMYVTGHGVERDRVQAYLWLSLAAQHGIGSALNALDGIVKHMSSEEKSQALDLFDMWRGKTAASVGPSRIEPLPG